MTGESPRRPSAAAPQTAARAPRAADLMIVAVGASAGGLDVFRALVPAFAPGAGMAFILVQHLDPNHDSLLVELLTSCTVLPVVEAKEGALLEAAHIYVIPPGRYLAVEDGALRLSEPLVPHGARLPFDFLLRSLAMDCGERTVCVVLSGTGADGSLGLQAVKDAGGFVIVQTPEEAGYDGMPRNAVLTGAANLVLPLVKIPPALLKRQEELAQEDAAPGTAPVRGGLGALAPIIDLVRERTSHDFHPYKPGTLRRRIERRMALCGIRSDAAAAYLDRLSRDTEEFDDLARDLLIHVTSFFRDPKVYEFLARSVIPELLATRPADQPLRVWVPGCSTGEEAYSLAILFREAIAVLKAHVKLQIFASDLEPDAVASAREGLFAEAIEADVSPERLKRFFTKEPTGYRVADDLRSAVVFTVQDVLVDPPFSRLDLISCRNLLIYLNPEAQARVISLFHFALRTGGVLVLGESETTGPADGRFEEVGKADRVYRHIGRSRASEVGFPIGGGETATLGLRASKALPPLQQTALADLCRRLLLANYTPAAALVTAKHECLYLLGATDRFLRVPQGQPTRDILAMAPLGLRTKLRGAILRAAETRVRVTLENCRVERDDRGVYFKIDVQPVTSEGEALFFICFVEHPQPTSGSRGPGLPSEAARVADLERELEATKTELRGAILDLELSGEEQRAISQEALSANEEFQSTNEELLTSKEELQSLNEELTALNTQLQETLERQRTTADDLQNVLYSTDLATLFLDRDLKIRFFTPTTKLLFNVIPGDVGRPFSDLSSLAGDTTLTQDAKVVLRGLVPIEKEIETEAGVCFVRRVLPYRTHGGGVEGVVITFTDITERKRVAKALEVAKLEAELANTAKSRFLAVASHDLRQPLQALSLLQGLLAKSVESDRARRLVERQGETLGTITGMLNTLLDINQIESGTVKVEKKSFPINDLLFRLRDELSYPARAKKLDLRVAPCSLWIESDPRLLEQMIRNLLSNALKYTQKGRILLGCRRRGRMVSIEIWDTGVGIAEDQLGAIFEEYHQIDNLARERSRGLGLGLSIVQRLGAILGHKVRVKSWPGRGSMFFIETPRPENRATRPGAPDEARPAPGQKKRTGEILLVEDDPDIRDLLGQLLAGEGHSVRTAIDGSAALALLSEGRVKPDLLLADFNLPGGMTGLDVVSEVRAALRAPTPSAILTGDITAETLRRIEVAGCDRLSKPVKPAEVLRLVQSLLPEGWSAPRTQKPEPLVIAPEDEKAIVFVIDDDDAVRAAIASVIADDGMAVETFNDAESFLAAYRPVAEGCLLIDAYLPGMNGLELLRHLASLGSHPPAIMITGRSDVAIAVQAMKSGAVDFIEKPIGRLELLAGVARALEAARDTTASARWRASAAVQIARLTARQREIMDMVLEGHPNKNIAADLGISQRTVENHRASIMKKTGAKSVPALARLALAAD
jgi:two-component system CheB/CheR fusion protein